MSRNEAGYIALVNEVIADGEERVGRNGTTLSVFGRQLRFDLTCTTDAGHTALVLPLLTTKKVPYRLVLEELKWFVSGRTDNKSLVDKKVRIWQGNADAGPLWPDSDPSAGDLGPIYGFQWRHFGAEYTGHKVYTNPRTGEACDGALDECEPDELTTQYDGKGVDQIAWIVKELKDNPGSRRAVMSAWNPVDIPKMALPPCHVLAQFWIGKRGLSCHMYQRSADLGLGVPFNIASYATLTHVIAHAVGVPPCELVMSFGDCHIYEGHVDALREQCTRDIRAAPTIDFMSGLLGEYSVDELMELGGGFRVTGYDPHPAVKMAMVA